MLWGAFLAELIDKRFARSAVYLLILAFLSLFGVIHSALADGSMYLPWTLDAATQRVPVQFAAAYAVLSVMVIALGRWSPNKAEKVVA
jgi:AGZA family xanthine/uracil permease-like MFS transporter